MCYNSPGRQIWDPQLKEPNMITNFFKWIRSTFTPQYQEEIHQYLSTSTDLCDLENKMNHLIRGGWIV